MLVTRTARTAKEVVQVSTVQRHQILVRRCLSRNKRAVSQRGVSRDDLWSRFKIGGFPAPAKSRGAIGRVLFLVLLSVG